MFPLQGFFQKQRGNVLMLGTIKVQGASGCETIIYKEIHKILMVFLLSFVKDETLLIRQSFSEFHQP